MRSMNLVGSVLFASLAVAGVQLGCSSDNSTAGPPTYPPFDSGAVSVPPGVDAGGSVAININGTGTVASSDVGTPDGGPYTGIVVCTATGGAKCKADLGTTLFAIAGDGFKFNGWSGGGATISIADTFQVSGSTPSPLTANFVATTTGNTTTPTPSDAGTGGGG